MDMVSKPGINWLVLFEVLGVNNTPYPRIGSPNVPLLTIKKLV